VALIGLTRKQRLVSFSTIALLLAGIGPALGQSSARKSGSASQKASPAFNEIARRADQERQAGRLDEAVKLYREGVKVRPKWEEGWWYLATILYDQDKYPEAKDAFRVLVSAQPKNGPATAMLGLCEFETGEYERALAELDRAHTFGLGTNEQLISVTRYHTAILCTRWERFEAGYEALLAFAHQQNESPKIIEAFGLNALMMPLLPSEIPPDKRDLVLTAGRAAFYSAARRQAEAARSFEELVARYPAVPNVHYAYGVFLLPERSDAALAEFQRELEISPSHIYSILQIVFEYIKRTDYTAALPYAEKAVQLAPDASSGHNALGRVLLETNDVARALSELELAAKMSPDSPQAHFALAHAYSRLGRKADAARERATFLRLDAESRAQREGPQSVGGTGAQSKPNDNPPK
jgi:tetratricopeptide (TPR) repeat protein